MATSTILTLVGLGVSTAFSVASAIVGAKENRDKIVETATNVAKETVTNLNK